MEYTKSTLGWNCFFAWCDGIETVHQFENLEDYDEMARMNETRANPGPFSFAFDTDSAGWAYFGNGAAGGHGWRVKVKILM